MIPPYCSLFLLHNKSLREVPDNSTHSSLSAKGRATHPDFALNSLLFAIWMFYDLLRQPGQGAQGKRVLNNNPIRGSPSRCTQPQGTECPSIRLKSAVPRCPWASAAWRADP